MSDRLNQSGAAQSLRETEMSPASPTAVEHFLSDGTTDDGITDGVTSGGVTRLADGVRRAATPGGDLPLASTGEGSGIRLDAATPPPSATDASGIRYDAASPVAADGPAAVDPLGPSAPPVATPPSIDSALLAGHRIDRAMAPVGPAKAPPNALLSDRADMPSLDLAGSEGSRHDRFGHDGLSAGHLGSGHDGSAHDGIGAGGTRPHAPSGPDVEHMGDASAPNSVNFPGSLRVDFPGSLRVDAVQAFADDRSEHGDLHAADKAGGLRPPQTDATLHPDPASNHHHDPIAGSLGQGSNRDNGPGASETDRADAMIPQNPAGKAPPSIDSLVESGSKAILLASDSSTHPNAVAASAADFAAAARPSQALNGSHDQPAFAPDVLGARDRLASAMATAGPDSAAITTLPPPHALDAAVPTLGGAAHPAHHHG